jgi:hypothetical protein
MGIGSADTGRLPKGKKCMDNSTYFHITQPGRYRFTSVAIEAPTL